MMDALIFCAPPVIVKLFVKQDVDAAGHTDTLNVLPEGEIVALLGTDSPAKEPVPSSASGKVGTVVFLSNGNPFWKYCPVGFELDGLKTNCTDPLAHACPPESVIVPLTVVVNCANAGIPQSNVRTSKSRRMVVMVLWFWYELKSLFMAQCIR
jgi:hypothetical protein